MFNTIDLGHFLKYIFQWSNFSWKTFTFVKVDEEIYYIIFWGTLSLIIGGSVIVYLHLKEKDQDKKK